MNRLTGFPHGIAGGCEHCGFRNVTENQWEKWGHIYGMSCGPCRAGIIKQNKKRGKK